MKSCAAPDRWATPRQDGAVTVAVPLAAGERVLGMTGEGDALSFLVEDAQGRQRVVTVDRRTGAPVGVLEFDAQ